MPAATENTVTPRREKDKLELKEVKGGGRKKRLESKSGIHELWSASCFCKLNFIGTQIHKHPLFMYCLYVFLCYSSKVSLKQVPHQVGYV